MAHDDVPDSTLAHAHHLPQSVEVIFNSSPDSGGGATVNASP